MSEFSGWWLWNLALEGVASFSTLSLRSWTYLGMLVAVLMFCYGAFVVLRTMIFGVVVPSYASELLLVLFFGGLQMIGLGVIDEYVDRIYSEARGRSIYLAKCRYQERCPCTRIPSINSRQAIPIASARPRQPQKGR